MTTLKKTLGSYAVLLMLAAPASAYTDGVVFEAVDKRVNSLQSQIGTLRSQYRDTGTSSREDIKRKMTRLAARRAQLGSAKHKVGKLPENKNHYVLSCFNGNGASIASYNHYSGKRTSSRRRYTRNGWANW